MNTEDGAADAKSVEARVCVNIEDGAGVNTENSAANAKSVAE